jgi:osmotically-inducible protein OsmY
MLNLGDLRGRFAAVVFVTSFTLVMSCGGGSEEQELEEASDALAVARETVEAARELVEEREAAVTEAESELAAARQELREAEGTLRERESQVDLKATDAVVFRAVQKRLLEDGDLRDVAIDADVAKGVVVLRGTVPDQETSDRAVEVATSVPGVVSVDSEIDVVPSRADR